MLAMAACLLVALLAIALVYTGSGDSRSRARRAAGLQGQPAGPAEPVVHRSRRCSSAPALKERKVPLDLISREVRYNLDINHDGRMQRAYLLIADPDLVPLFGLKALHGDLRATLTRHDGIAMTSGSGAQALGRTALGASDGSAGSSRAACSTPSPRSSRTSIRAARCGCEPDGRRRDGDGRLRIARQSHERRAARRQSTWSTGRVFARLRPGRLRRSGRRLDA